MFLDWIAQLRLLHHDPQTNILGTIPLAIKRTLISEITSYIYPTSGKHIPDPSIFVSPAHVKWFMEVLGQGFTLPLEDMHITNDNVSIYAQWLFEPSMRPAAVVKGGLEQELYQIIFHQFSLLFQSRIPRATSSQTAYYSHSATVGGRPNSYHSTINTTSAIAATTAATTASNSPAASPMPLAPPPAQPPAPTHPTPLSTPLAPPLLTPPSTTPNLLKETVSQLVQRHVELCKRTLTVLATAGRTLELTEETWTVLLKVVLGITDSLLKEPMGDTFIAGVGNMGDQLCDHLLKVLYELWLRSETKQVEMWDIFKDCFARWTHRPHVIQQWSAMSLALTRYVQSHLSNTQEKYVTIVSVSGVQVRLDLPQEFVYYAWHRFVYFIPHPLQLAPHNFNLAMIGIGQIIGVLHHSHYNYSHYNHNNSNNSNSNSNNNTVASTMPPDGNTLLHMFGTILFDVCSKTLESDTESHRGFSEAYAILCQLFCRPQPNTPFLRTYTERFYAALCIGLKVEACIPTILMNSTELFAIDLEGVRMLVPDFITAIKGVLPKYNLQCKCYVSVDELRLAAIKVMSTVMSLPNHFDKVELRPGWDTELQRTADHAALLGEQEQLVTQLIRVLYSDQKYEDVERPFTCLKFYILELLLMSLRTETSSYNMRYLLHLINVYVVEDVPFCPGLVGTVVKLIQDKILTMKLPPDVTLVAFDVLMDFVDLYDYVKRDSKVRLNDISATRMTRALNTIFCSTKNVARELVLALSRYVDALINAEKLLHTYPLIVQAYDCMMKWVLVSQWIIDDRDCYQAVIATLSRGITLFDRDPDIVGPVEVNIEKKKRRETTFPPAKQLFLLPPRGNKNTQQNTETQQPTLPASHRPLSVHHKKEEVAVRMAAEYCMSQFVNQLGKFQSLNEHSLVHCRSAQMDDLCYLKDTRAQLGKKEGKEETNPYDSIRYFLLDKRMILGVVDLSNAPKTSSEEHINKPSVLLIIRDPTGSYMWELDATYKEKGACEVLASDTKGKKPLPSIRQSILVDDSSRENVFFTPTATSMNEKELPSLDKLFKENTEDWHQWNDLKLFMEKQNNPYESKRIRKNTLENYTIAPPKPNIDVSNPRGFRLLLSQLGLLLPHNREKITSLRITDTTISELETLDALNERDCVSVAVYYAACGDTTWKELVETPPPLNELYLQFLNCLGWPVNIKYHDGFKGKLDSDICEKAPYYADRSVEFLANVPYLLKVPPENTSSWQGGISDIHQQVSVDDHVCIVWIEDLTRYEELAKRIKASSLPSSKTMVYLFINPLKKSADGLYRIRIYIPSSGSQTGPILPTQRLNENALLFGPLVDGIVVSRHALGAMVRNTIISAHQACRVVTNTYTKPFVIRKQFIEDMAHRHRVKVSLSEFYSDIFSEKEALSLD
ncbi:hypothetical protein BDF14DRAFT_1956776 [Spinellus fusiger]|nr:hypothetical protein BDF14DRAFT_1956776 [Spinellus fusiger]